MDIKKIKKIVKIFETSNITELEISEGNKSLRISCSYNEKNIINKELLKNVHSTITNPATSQVIEKKGYIVHSPMVGIFYRKANDNSNPFVEIGQKVKIGDVLCIVEAMKMMNQITAEKSGIIKEIFIENGQPVEFDEPLFIIE